MSFSPQPEIQAYLRRTAERSGTLDRFRFDTTVESAALGRRDPALARADLRRRLHLLDPDRRRRRALRAAAARHRGHRRLPGRAVPLRPLEPRRRPGRQAGRGHRHRRLGDPDRARGPDGPPAHLDVYQRTAPYVLPRNDRRLRPAREARAAPRAGPAEALPDRDLLGPRGLRARLHARARSSPGRPRSWRWRTSPRASRTPSCARRLTPTFEIGCKRILISNTYYPALASDNVELVTDPIAKVTGDAIVTADGVERPVDVLVVATGFYTTELPIAERITGRDRPHAGRHLARARHGGVQGHDGPGLPQPVLPRRPQHRPRPLQHGVHDRVAGRLRPRRDQDHEPAPVRRGRAAPGRDARVERRASSGG